MASIGTRAQAWTSAGPRLAAAVGVLMLTLSACATGAGTQPPGVTVTLEDNLFVVPGGQEEDGLPFLTVPVGTTVTFENAGAVDHTASQFEDGSFDSSATDFHLVLMPGSSDTVTVDEVGTFEVGCVFHPDMKMTLNVE